MSRCVLSLFRCSPATRRSNSRRLPRSSQERPSASACMLTWDEITVLWTTVRAHRLWGPTGPRRENVRQSAWRRASLPAECRPSPSLADVSFSRPSNRTSGFTASGSHPGSYPSPTHGPCRAADRVRRGPPAPVRAAPSKGPEPVPDPVVSRQSPPVLSPSRRLDGRDPRIASASGCPAGSTSAQRWPYWSSEAAGPYVRNTSISSWIPSSTAQSSALFPSLSSSLGLAPWSKSHRATLVSRREERAATK